MCVLASADLYGVQATSAETSTYQAALTETLPSAGRAIAAATWLIRQTASADLSVGGPVQAGLVDASGALLVPPERIAEIDACVRRASDALDATLTEAALLLGA